MLLPGQDSMISRPLIGTMHKVLWQRSRGYEYNRIVKQSYTLAATSQADLQLSHPTLYNKPTNITALHSLAFVDQLRRGEGFHNSDSYPCESTHTCCHSSSCDITIRRDPLVRPVVIIPMSCLRFDVLFGAPVAGLRCSSGPAVQSRLSHHAPYP